MANVKDTVTNPFAAIEAWTSYNKAIKAAHEASKAFKLADETLTKAQEGYHEARKAQSEADRAKYLAQHEYEKYVTGGENV